VSAYPSQNLRIGVRHADDPSFERSKHPFRLMTVWHFLGIHIPDMVTPRLCLFTIRIEARDKILSPEIRSRLLSRHGFFRDSPTNKLLSAWSEVRSPRRQTRW
jgi:hypothetical protein